MSNNTKRQFINANSNNHSSFSMKDNWIEFQTNNNMMQNRNTKNKFNNQQTIKNQNQNGRMMKSANYNNGKYNDDLIIKNSDGSNHEHKRQDTVATVPTNTNNSIKSNGLSFVPSLPDDNNMSNDDANLDSGTTDYVVGLSSASSINSQQQCNDNENESDINNNNVQMTNLNLNSNNECQANISIVPNQQQPQPQQQQQQQNLNEPNQLYQIQYSPYNNSTQQQIYEVIPNPNGNVEMNQQVYGTTPTTTTYETYEYSTPNQHQQIMHHHQQQQPPCYIWSSPPQQQYTACDYATVAAANAAAAAVAASSTNGATTTAPTTAYYSPSTYGSNSAIPYLYDPAIAAASYSTTTNMVATTTYSPMQNQQQSIMSSPQHQSTLFNAYQTPPSMGKHPHQLYMTPPASGSPATDLTPTNNNNNNNNNISVIQQNDRLTNCESPKVSNTMPTQQQTGVPNGPQTIYTTNPYVYPTPYHLASPYQCQSLMPTAATTTYMMYSPPAAPPPTLQFQQPSQQHQHNLQMLQTTPTTTMQNLSINTTSASPLATPLETNNLKYNSYYNKYNNCNIKANHYNYKRNLSKHKYQSLMNSYSPSCDSNSNNLFAMNSPTIGTNQQLCFDDSTDETTSAQHLNDLNGNIQQQNNYSPSIYSPPLQQSSFMSQSPLIGNSYPMQTPLAYDYCNHSNTGLNLTNNIMTASPVYSPGNNANINNSINGNSLDYDNFQSYSCGDEYVDDNNSGDLDDDGNEQLACQICRGRRMCFCYFLKVRYYKFPSFFDLVDHQYKKWRSSMAKTTPPPMLGTAANIRK